MAQQEEPMELGGRSSKQEAHVAVSAVPAVPRMPLWELQPQLGDRLPDARGGDAASSAWRSAAGPPGAVQWCTSDGEQLAWQRATLHKSSLHVCNPMSVAGAHYLR